MMDATRARRVRLPLVALLIGLGCASAAAAPTPPGASAAPGFRVPVPVKTVLKNGLTLLVSERRSIPLVQIQLMVKSGSVSDPVGKEGTASLVSRLLKRGTLGRPAAQFFEEVEFVGGTIDTSAESEASYVRAEFATRDVEIGFNLVADLLLNPAFRPEEIEKEKRRALAEIGEILDDPELVAKRAFGSWLYGAHPYGRPPGGTARSIGEISRVDIIKFYEQNYVPGNAVLVIVGDVDAAQSAMRVEHYLSSWKRHPVPAVRIEAPPSVRGRRILLIDKPDATQSQIRFGNVGIKRGDPDFFPLLVGNSVLGGAFTSWLSNEVRVKRGLTYSIDSALDARRASGSFIVSTSSRNSGVLETIKVSLDQLGRWRGDRVPAEDIDKARNYLCGLYPLRIESPEALAAEILSIDLYGLDPDFINQYQKRVRLTSVDAVKRAAASRLPLDDLAIVVVGPANSLKKDLESLGPVTVRSLQSVVEDAPSAGPAAR